MSLKVFRIILHLIASAVLLSACQAGSAQPATTPITATGLPTAVGQAAIEPVVLPTATPPPTPAPAIWLAPYVPDRLRASLLLPAGWEVVEQAEGAIYIFDALPKAAGQLAAPDSRVNWIYALTAPFPALTDQVALTDLMRAWRGQTSDGLALQTLLVDESTRGVFTKRWGKPGSLVKTLPTADLLERAWAGENTWAILPFEQLDPRWKVIAVDEQNPVQKAFDPDKYGLTVPFGLSGIDQQADEALFTEPLAASNRSADHLTTVMLTGVTALVRGTAAWMEYYGNEYPAMYIGDWLREADILHISNEVPFAKNCPDPFPWEGLVFCSRTKYIELLESIGTDVVELTGDHFQDWGEEAMLLTIKLYKERGWPYYGGGLNRTEAQQPALFEHNGNKIAFLGCNAKPPGYAGADDDSPGAVHCDFDQLVQAVQQVRADGYLPIVTFQHLEYYSYDAHPILQADFRRVAEAGAVIVSGSQAHQPHAMEFLDSDEMKANAANPPDLSFLHYGLGNLFFDQVQEGFPTRQAFIDRHVVYEGRHISTELLSILFIDLARARQMTPEERLDLLTTINKASGW